MINGMRHAAVQERKIAANLWSPGTNFKWPTQADIGVRMGHHRYVHASAPPCRFDLRDVDLFHPHHRLKGTLCFCAAGGKRVRQSARSDLPGKSPAILAPTALTFLAAV